jgi:hypothetical protein
MHFFMRIVLVAAALSLIAIAPSVAQQLTITSPPSGAVVVPGQTITIYVSPSSLAAQTWVFASEPLPEVVPASSPNTFTLTISTTISPGQYALRATAGAPGTVARSAPVYIDVEPSEVSTSITISPSTITFDSIGDQIRLLVTGAFSGGQQVNITHSSYIQYSSSDDRIATVGSDGIVSGVNPGCAQINVAAQGQSGSIPVIVPVGQGPIAYNITGALVPLHRGFDELIGAGAQGRQRFGIDQYLDAPGHAGLASDQRVAFEREHHLVD